MRGYSVKIQLDGLSLDIASRNDHDVRERVEDAGWCDRVHLDDKPAIGIGGIRPGSLKYVHGATPPLASPQAVGAAPGTAVERGDPTLRSDEHPSRGRTLTYCVGNEGRSSPMGVSDITDPGAVHAAIAEFERLGRDAFLERYGYHHSRKFLLDLDGKLYDSKAILGVAHGYQFPSLGPLTWEDLSGGTQTVNKLVELRFHVINTASETLPSGRVFGEIAGQLPGTRYENRAELARAGVHRPLEAGISASESEGADSIVISGGYEDDEDYGNLIVYTGHGGRDMRTGRQVADQKFRRGNRALARNWELGRPVRVTRGHDGDPRYSPESGFRYDGLFNVESYWSDRGQSGFLVWRYRLVRNEDSLELADREDDQYPTELESGRAPRINTTVQRLVRNTAVTNWVKELHGYRCQVCGEILMTPAGPYAEGAHIRALGRPHDGPDIASNVLCLCPNDHVRFDSGAIYIDDDHVIVDRATASSLGRLRSVTKHVVVMAYLRYHREHFGAGEFQAAGMDGDDT